MNRASVSDELLRFANKHRVFFTPFGNDKVQGRFRNGENLMFSPDLKIEPYTCFLGGSFLYSMGSFSFSRSHFPVLSGVSVGRYCSIGARLSILGINHPIERFTSSSISYDRHSIISTSFFADNPDLANFQVNNTEPKNTLGVTIGNDVWVGEDVTISRGVKIGDGAILAAKSMITKDVPPYAIVGGIPANVIRYRFSPDIVEKLIQLNWWNYDLKDFLISKADIAIEEFVESVNNRIDDKRIALYSPSVLTSEMLLGQSKHE